MALGFAGDEPGVVVTIGVSTPLPVLILTVPAESLPLSHREGHGSYPPTERGEKEGVLTWRLRETDERVVIHGASGNVGMLAIQFAKLRGARVLAIASGSDGVALARRLGADESLDGRADDLDASLEQFAPDGVDAVLTFVGGKQLTRCLDALKKRGRVAYPSGIEPEPRKRRGIRMASYDAESGVREFERLNAAITESRLEIPIAAVFALEDVARAHERIEQGHVIGRIVLDIRRGRDRSDPAST